MTNELQITARLFTPRGPPAPNGFVARRPRRGPGGPGGLREALFPCFSELLGRAPDPGTEGCQLASATLWADECVCTLEGAEHCRARLSVVTVAELCDHCTGQDNVDDFAAIYEPLSKECLGKLSVRIV